MPDKKTAPTGGKSGQGATSTVYENLSHKTDKVKIIDTNVNTEFPELSQADFEAIMELAGKLEFDGGMEHQEATLQALKEVLGKREPAPGEAARKGPRNG